MANEFIVKNGLIVSGSANIQSSLTAQSFTGSFSGSTAAPGSEGDIPRNVGGVLTADGDLQYEVTGGEAVLTLGVGGGGAGALKFIGPSGPFLTTNGPLGFNRFTQGGQQYIELNDTDGTLRLAAGSTVIATVDSLSQGMGVGINVPTARLHVKGTGTTDATTGLRVENANSSASLIVLDDGKVGVNTSSPTQTLEVNGGIGFNGSSYHTSGEIITQYQESFSTPGQYFYLINPTGGGFGPDTVGINYYITSYSGYGLEVGGTTKFHNSVDFGLFANLTLTSGSLEVTGSTNITGSLNVTGPIYNNGVNVQSLSIAYAIALG